ncbi:MAG: 16S rRNA (guanine(966)-N(2))-methyltransferase RsmD [Firmicutes bacterium]|nr:16S rRNA (guanine(966)-N(2))-methyltransferase RsmD [Bacillota bacterium]
MKVIAGVAKGHKLKTTAGKHTRPTSGKVKEAMFSIIQSFLHNSMALDLFAGSGALGIEALSRGASYCDFVEQSKKAVEIIAFNLEKTRLNNYNIHNTAVKNFLSACTSKYDLVFIDPPYNKNLPSQVLQLMSERALLADNAIIVCETGADEKIDTSLKIYKQSVYGDTKLTFYENR